jgi:L-rhamnose mutarotase
MAEQYKRRHDELWPEMANVLKEAGIHDFSIFLDSETNTLFAYQKVRDGGGSQDLGTNSVVQRWWAHMADIMVSNPDNSPVSIPLKEVFYME